MDRLGNQCKEDEEIMINVSDQLLKESKENQDYYVTANVTLADGTKLPLKKEDFYLDGNGIVDSADSSSFPVGVAIEKTATLSLVNDEEQFSGYSFNRAVFTIYMNLELSDGKVETFKRGSFIVCKKPAIDEEINLTLLDYMSKTDRSYETNLTFPCTVGEVLQDSCQTCGITIGDATFKNSDFRVMKKPTGTTHRAVIGMVAALAGGNARIDENNLLRIVTYQAVPKVVKLVEAPWTDASGNNIYDIEENEIIITKEDITIGLKLEEGIDDVQTDIDIITVTGVKYTEDERDYIYGQEGYLIDLKENQLLSGNAEDGVNCIGRILTGFQILPFSVSSIPIGYATFGDAVQFEDYRGNIYRSYATDIEFLFADSTNFSCKAKSVESQGAEYLNENKVLIEQAKEDTRQKMTAYDIKLKQMNELAANTLGFYFTIENLTDGSAIVYRHDKPTLKESKIIYKNGIDGFFLSVDGGETWKSGFDSNGDAVLNILYAIGIQAEYINTRGLTAKDNDGNITFRINADTGEVEINGSSVYIGEKRVDKMLEDMNNTIASAKNMTLQLSNDMQTITADSEGNIPVFPLVSTRATVMYGTQDITGDCSFTVTKSDGVTGSWDEGTHTYTVKGLTADDGWVDIKATYLINLSITKRFTISKQRSGKPGSAGKGIKGTPKSQYQVSESGTTTPTDAWSDTIPTVPEGKYLWTKTVTEYTDGTSTTGYSVSHIGKNGTEGNGVTGTEVAYQASDNGTTPPTGEWSKNPPESKPGQYIWTRVITTYSKGNPVTSYSVGKIGENGKQLYTWRKYALRADGLDMTDSPEYTVLLDTAGTPLLDAAGQKIYAYAEAIYVGIADNKTTETPSDNPKDYIWSRFRGEDGADGIGIPGENGETSYIHTAYANSPDGTKDFSTTDSDRIYIGHYTDFEKPDSSDPTKYTWARMRGEDGVPGRTYYLRANAGILLMGQDKKVTPEKLTVNAYYRDGQGEETAYAGWWKAERSSDSGKTWTTITLNQTEATGACTITSSLQIIGSRGMIRVTCYLDQAKTSIADMQTYSVALDVAALTQEQIVEILSNDGEFKGLYYVNKHLYISLDALLGSCATLGGKKNGNGYLKIQDANGTVKGLIDHSGYTAFTSYEENSKYMKYTGAQLSSDGIFPVNVEKYFDNTVDEITELELWSIDWSDGLSIDASYGSFGELNCYGGTLLPDMLKISDVFTVKKALATGEFFYAEFQKELACRGGIRVYDYPTVTTGYDAYIDINSYKLGKYSSSSERYKVLGSSLSEEFIENLYNIEPIMARYKDGYLEEHDERVGVEFPMFRAEDVDEYFPLAVDHIDGKAENWNERIMIPAMFAMIKQQKQEIELLKQQISKGN